MNKPKKRTTKRTSIRKKEYPEMKSWDLPSHRQEALKRFVDDLNAMKDTEVEKFVKSHAKTKTKFAACGPFYVEGKNNPNYAPWTPQCEKVRIPKTTTFRVYRNGDEGDREEREKTVVLIVNPKQNAPEPIEKNIIQSWRCTYTPYLEKKK